MAPGSGQLFGPLVESRESVTVRLATGVSRLMRKRRLERLIGSDPGVLDPRVQPTSRTLGFSHVYVVDQTGEVERWLGSPASFGALARRPPIDGCQLAIDQFHTMLETGSEALKDTFLVTASTLYEMGHLVTLDRRPCFLMPHFHRAPGYADHVTPWLSARTQGWLGGLFARAYQLGGDARYADAAVRAIRPCLVSIERGGVRGIERTGEIFYEKYAFRGQATHVLHGFLSTLLGIWDVARATGEPDAHAAFDQGVAALTTSVLATYDNGSMSLHDQAGDRRLSSQGVIHTWIHAHQLAALARIAGERRFVRWAERWRGYSMSPSHRMVARALSPDDGAQGASAAATVALAS